MPSAPTKLMHDQLRPALKRLAPDVEWQLTGPIGRARKCDIFKITNDQHTHTLALKVYRPGKTNARGPQNQFKALQQLESISGAAISAPRVHAFVPAANAIVMDWIDAPPLRNALWRSAFSNEDKLAYVASAAKWLRGFHESTGIEHKPINFSKLIDQLTNRLNECPIAVDQMKDGDLFFNAFSRLQKFGSSAPPRAPHAKLHGDFTPSNVLIQKGEAIGIDIWGVRYGPVFEDTARMLTYLGINSPFALKRAPLVNDDKTSAVFNAFVSGYGHDLMQAEDPAIWHIILYQQLRRWLVFLDWKKQGRSAIKAQLELERVRRLTQQTMLYLDRIYL